MKIEAGFQKQWIKLEQKFYRKFGKKPDIEAILMLIGMQELHNSQHKFDKEEKQDLMHIAACTILSPEGYYRLREYDEDGWPHFDRVKDLPKHNADEQEAFLKQHILRYFEMEDISF